MHSRIPATPDSKRRTPEDSSTTLASEYECVQDVSSSARYSHSSVVCYHLPSVCAQHFCRYERFIEKVDVIKVKSEGCLEVRDLNINVFAIGLTRWTYYTAM